MLMLKPACAYRLQDGTDDRTFHGHHGELFPIRHIMLMLTPALCAGFLQDGTDDRTFHALFKPIMAG
jgi:hypothetical protein